MERKLAAILFSDIAGFTKLTALDEEKAFELINQQRELFQPLVKQYDGEWLKEIGDGLLLLFSSSKKALNCAIALQEQSSKIDNLNIRIGLHQGDVIKSENDVIGDDVNIASRIEPLSAIGGIAISEKVVMDLTSSPEYKFKYLGIPELKGVEQNIKVFSVSSHSMPIPKAFFRTKRGTEVISKSPKITSMFVTIVFTLTVFFSYPLLTKFIDTKHYDTLRINDISIIRTGLENSSALSDALQFGIEKNILDLGNINLITSVQSRTSIGMLNSEPLLLNAKVEQNNNYTDVNLTLNKGDGTLFAKYYKQYLNKDIKQVINTLVNITPIWINKSMAVNRNALDTEINHDLEVKYPIKYYELMGLITGGNNEEIQNAIIELDELSILDDSKWIPLLFAEAYALLYLNNNSKSFLEEAQLILERFEFIDPIEKGHEEYVKSLISYSKNDFEQASINIKLAIKHDRNEKRYRVFHHKVRSIILNRMANND